ncbi:MAG: hypothetical protein E6G81_07420 [Alphaproteobacteria bacterium]|nr:MAG: hypothetical protein E6G81_07420 [Alphaproteobacteria bacterium]
MQRPSHSALAGGNLLCLASTPPAQLCFKLAHPGDEGVALGAQHIFKLMNPRDEGGAFGAQHAFKLLEAGGEHVALGAQDVIKLLDPGDEDVAFTRHYPAQLTKLSGVGRPFSVDNGK